VWSQAGQTPLAIAERLGYISVIDILTSVTDETLRAPAASSTEKYSVVLPETMHDSSLSDSDDEGSHAHLHHHHHHYHYL